MCRLRQWTALSLVFALLSVSSIPMVAVAEICDMPGMNTPMPMVMDDASERCYIGCGCKAHKQLDALPHQLAPHALDSAVAYHGIDNIRPLQCSSAALSALSLKVPLPPPETLIL